MQDQEAECLLLFSTMIQRGRCSSVREVFFYVSTLSWQSHWHMDVSRFWYHATLTRKDTLSGYSKCSTVMVLVAAAVTVQFISGCQRCFRILNCNVKCYVWSLWTFFSCLRGDKFHLRTTTNYFQSYGLIFF